MFPIDFRPTRLYFTLDDVPKFRLKQYVHNFFIVAEINELLDQVDPWTKSMEGCPCHFDDSRTDCACCQKFACQCAERNRNQCVTCGHPEHCGIKEHVFGPNSYCEPKVCPATNPEEEEIPLEAPDI